MFLITQTHSFKFYLNSTCTTIIKSLPIQFFPKLSFNSILILKQLIKARFDELFQYKNRIERKFGKKLDWQRLDDRRASRIKIEFKGVGLRNKEHWSKLQDKMITAMVRMKEVFDPYIVSLKK